MKLISWKPMHIPKDNKSEDKLIYLNLPSPLVKDAYGSFRLAPSIKADPS